MSEGASEAAVPRPARGPRSRKDDQVDAAPRQNTGSVQSMLSTSSRADRTPRLIVLVEGQVPIVHWNGTLSMCNSAEQPRGDADVTCH